jgi:putative hydrolase of the HAD superfamily
MSVNSVIIWNEIDTVLLDMDGTLLDLHFDNYFWQEYLPLKWGEVNRLDTESAKNMLVPRFYSKAGTLSWYCLDHWTEELGMDILGLKADVVHLIRERPGTTEFLQFLARRGKRKALVTNAHQGLIKMKFERTSIGQHFEHVICAHDLGLPKEDPEFWGKLHAVFPFDPDRTMLIDDNASVLRSARGYGIRHLLSIAQPDSKQPRRDGGEFVTLESFEDIY